MASYSCNHLPVVILLDKMQGHHLSQMRHTFGIDCKKNRDKNNEKLNLKVIITLLVVDYEADFHF